MGVVHQDDQFQRTLREYMAHKIEPPLPGRSVKIDFSALVQRRFAIVHRDRGRVFAAHDAFFGGFRLGRNRGNLADRGNGGRFSCADAAGKNKIYFID
jgi:hypothetical protein